jgi:hypothetical protein
MRLLKHCGVVATLLVAVASTAAIAQVQVNLPSMKDNTLYEDDLGMGTVSNGAGQHMFVGTTSAGFLRRALVAFDIVGNVPAGSTIQSVVLTLNMSRTAATGTAITIDLRAATQGWGEGTSVADGEEGRGAPATPGDATWLHTFFDTQLWIVQGGDSVVAPSATITVDQAGSYSWSDVGMVSDVQGWLDQPSTNFGWSLIATNFEHLPQSAKRFDTRENADPTAQPVLAVTYTPPVGALSVDIPSMKDNTLFEDSQGMLSDGAGQHMFVGTTNLGVVRRALVAFDIAGNIPAGATIQSAVLKLNMSKTAGPPIDVDLLMALVDWGEGTSVGAGEEGAGAPATPGDATWIHTFFDTALWTTPGGDFAAAPSATTTVDQIGTYIWSDAGMVTDVQGWLDQPSTNFGWGLIATNFEHVALIAKRLDTRENADPAAQPLLSVAYVPPP